MSIHQVSIKMASGYNVIPVMEYKKISLVEQVQLIQKGRIQFLDITGNTIPIMDALKLVREL